MVSNCKTMWTLESLQQAIDPLLPGLLGIRLIQVAPERVVAELEVRPNLCTTGGVLHGGATMAFADTLGAIGTFLNLAPDRRTTTTDSSTKFIGAARIGTIVVGECSALHRGRTTMVWQTNVKSAEGKLCAVVTQTQLVLET
jgi:1,4-dihydroxy-2-naphthoyl-CoA hydrolase